MVLRVCFEFWVGLVLFGFGMGEWVVFGFGVWVGVFDLGLVGVWVGLVLLCARFVFLIFGFLYLLLGWLGLVFWVVYF